MKRHCVCGELFALLVSLALLHSGMQNTYIANVRTINMVFRATSHMRLKGS